MCRAEGSKEAQGGSQIVLAMSHDKIDCGGFKVARGGSSKIEDSLLKVVSV